jgi:regulator of sigma D
MLGTLNIRGLGTKEFELIGELEDKKVSTTITEIWENLKHATQLLMTYSDVNNDNIAVAGAIHNNDVKTEIYVCN